MINNTLLPPWSSKQHSFRHTQLYNNNPPEVCARSPRRRITVFTALNENGGQSPRIPALITIQLSGRSGGRLETSTHECIQSRTCRCNKTWARSRKVFAYWPRVEFHGSQPNSLSLILNIPENKNTFPRIIAICSRQIVGRLLWSAGFRNQLDTSNSVSDLMVVAFKAHFYINVLIQRIKWVTCSSCSSPSDVMPFEFVSFQHICLNMWLLRVGDCS